ncbi:MAG: hypothetical protein GX271_05010 [Clostridiales bacterium]|nr:hypothetical protein [Clostridiales bacterium]
MKKLIIISMFCIISLNLLGCSKAELEEKPLVVEDSSDTNIDVSEPDLEQDNQKILENQSEITDIETNSQETTDGKSSIDNNQGDPESRETTKPYKAIVMVEGMEEEVNYQTYQSENGYQMAYDVDRFTVTSENGIDTYMAENINPEIYPYVFISIYKSEFDDKNRGFSGNLQLVDKKTNEVVTFNASEENVKLGSYDAIHYQYIHGNQWNSLVRHIYVISLEKIYYVIHTNYFLEASEGYGARIKAMLDTIVIEGY